MKNFKNTHKPHQNHSFGYNFIMFCVGYNTKLENLDIYETFFQINKKMDTIQKSDKDIN